jgi:Ran GTPase-activating protein 1
MDFASTVFSLEGKGLKLDTAADIEPHIAALRVMNDVTEVRFLGNTLGTEACDALADVLATKKSLQIANLADIFTARLLSEIPPALSSLLMALLKLPNLHTVNLSDNAFGLNTVGPLVDFLSAHVPLRHLILNNNGLGPKAGALVADALSTLHSKKVGARKAGTTVPDLETVVCGRNRLENGSMEAWAKAYSLHSNIKEIRMVQNGIRQEGTAHLLRKGLKDAKALKKLDMQDNTFTILGAKALADVVQEWTEIEEIGVGDCLLSARGGVVLAEALAHGKNKTLLTLRLQFNDIDANGLKHFAHAVKEALPALQRIELNGNKFSEEDDSVTAIRTVLGDRREKSGAGDDDETWGIDELDELEEESEEEEGSEEEEEEEEEKRERVLKEAEQAEEENVPLEKDKAVDDLAEKLGKTEI